MRSDAFKRTETAFHTMLSWNRANSLRKENCLSTKEERNESRQFTNCCTF